MIRVNLEDTFEQEELSKDFSFMTFYAPLKEGGEVLLKVSIEALNDPMLPNTYNLAFGPMDDAGNIDDTARVFHDNPDKVFSTILLFCLLFLRNNADFQIGLDGSDDPRAYLYHRMFITNKDYLDEYFETFGVDWYLRQLRNGDFETDENGQIFLKPKSENFNYRRSLKDLYRYYVFRLSRDKTEKRTINLLYESNRRKKT
ncbi:DUF6934 family protein [Chitinophaga sp. 22620]|uniref:DUF6934 family protein n=1 Tax=Chitinophaga sp. 22620 TaxID=3453952 RepID=UPI003F82CBCC